MQALLNGNARSRSPSPSRPTHVQEQHDLRNETINAFHEAVSDGEDQDDGDLLTLREKTQDELQKEEEEYRTYLERAVGDVKSLVQIEETQIASTSAAAEPSPISTDNVKKKSKKDRKGRKQESDQEFLMK
jgi:protein KRI1